MTRIRRIHWYLLTGAVFSLLAAGTLTALARGDLLVALAPAGAGLLIATVATLFYRESQRMIEQDNILLSISEGFATRMELGDVLDHIVRTILRSVPLADKCVIHLLDERGRRLFPRYSSPPDWERTLGMPANRGIAGQALHERRTIVVNDVRRERDFLPLHSSSDLRALMVAPLHAHGKAMGTISLNSKRAGAFSRRDELLVTALAAQASAAIYQSQLYAASQRETYHVEAIINNLTDGLVVLDAEGRVVRYNPSLAHILGVDPSRIVGRMVDPRSEIPGLRLLARLLGERPRDLRQSYERQVEIDAPEISPGAPLHAIMRVQVSPVLDHEGNWGQIAVLRDETEALDRVRARAGLLAAAARELRPPLESIRSYATLLKSRLELPPPGEAPSGARSAQAARDWIGRIHEQSARLLRLADNLTDLCAAELGELAPHPRPVDVPTLLRGVVAELTPAAERKGARVVLRYPGELATVAWDEDRVRHVLLSLGENAIQRVQTGGAITFGIEVDREEVTLTVADDGRPLASDVRARVFQGSYRPNDMAQQAKTADTGLWLYVCRKIVESHGGHLWVAENGAQGSCLQLILPLAVARETRAPERTERPRLDTPLAGC